MRFLCIMDDNQSQEKFHGSCPDTLRFIPVDNRQLDNNYTYRSLFYETYLDV